MVAQLEDDALTGGLGALAANVTHITVCAGEPTTYALATTAGNQMLGYKNFGAGNAFSTPAPSGGNEMTASTAITDGTVSSSDTASWWAAVDEDHGVLYAHGALTTPKALVVNNKFSLPSFNITMPT